MPFDPAFLTVMPSTLKVRRVSGVGTDGYGQPTFSATTMKLRCRVTEKQTLVRTAEGTMEVARTVCWVRSTSSFGPSDSFELPDGSTPPPLAVEEYRDEAGTLHHQKVYFG
jgi:hypothetical protein